MKVNYFLGTSIALWASQAAATWSVHESCKDIEPLLDQIIADIIPKITRAADELEKQDINKDVDDLAKILFGTDPQQRQQAAGFMAQLGHLGNKVDHSTMTGILPVGHVAFYCGKDGVKDHVTRKSNGQDVGFHPELNVEGDLSDDYKACRGDTFSNLVTDTKALTTTRSVIGQAGSTVWIAQKEFDKVKKHKYKSAGDITKEIWDNIVKKPQIGLMSKLISKKPMDALALFDMTITHELMHTDLAGMAKDMDKDGQNTMDAYGWKACAGGNPNGYKNAESLAFFVQGVTAIIDKGHHVKDNGWFEKIVAAAKMFLRRWVA